MTAARRFLLPLLVAGLLLGVPRTDAGAEDEAPWETELTRLLEELPGWDVKTWAETCERLAALGSKAVPALTRALSDANPQVRLRAAKALRRIGGTARSAGPALAENLIDDQLFVRAAAAVALGRVDPDRAVKTLPGLLAAPQDPKDRHHLWQGLAAAGEVAAPVLRMELMRGRAYRQQVFAAVAELGVGGASILRVLVGDASWHIRLWSIRATIALPELPATLAEAISNAAKDESDAVASAATWRMAQAQPSDPWFIPHLARLVLGGRVGVRRAATYGLAHTSPWDTSLVVPLLNSVRDSDEAVRINSARGLALFESYQTEARAALAPLLGAPEQRVRIAAAWSLVQLGDLSGAPAPALIEAVNRYGGIGTPFRYYLRSRHLGTGGGGRKKFDPPVMDLDGAALALLALGPDAIAAIERAARITEGYRRVLFVYALGRMGARAIPALERLLHSKDLLVRNIAACCLAKSGARGKAAVPLLVRLASQYDPYDPVVIEVGEDLSAEIVEEESDQLIGATSWIRESHDALIAIGAPALEALRAAGAADPVIAKRLAPVISAIEE